MGGSTQTAQSSHTVTHSHLGLWSRKKQGKLGKSLGRQLLDLH
jgi:hypothetical protein